jgi:hypothetical protein
MLLIAAFQLSEAPGAASCAQPVAAIPHARQREQGEYRYSLWSLHRHPLLFVMPVPVRRCVSLSTGNANCAVQANISTITSHEGCF